MRVEDVLTPTSCVCRTEEGRLLDGESRAQISFFFFNPLIIMCCYPAHVTILWEAGVMNPEAIELNVVASVWRWRASGVLFREK